MSADGWAIRLEGVSKRYLLGRRRIYLGHLLAAFRRGGIPRIERSDGADILRALDAIDLEVERGTALGIIGPNGAGKTSVLSLIAGITAPSAGRVRVRGRVGALIQLGAGFHPDLTGRENVFLYGAMLGMPRAEIARRYDRIEAFAGIERFMETPVKRYSSGMILRLGYSVAVHLDPENLLVDEALAVGDLPFQEKCLRHMARLRRGGRTVVLVSHNLQQVEGVCDRVIWLERGGIRMDGPPTEVVPRYLDAVEEEGVDLQAEDPGSAETAGETPLRITRLEVFDSDGRAAGEVPFGAGIRIRISFRSTQRVERPHFVAWVSYRGVEIFRASMAVDGAGPEWVEGDGAAECEIPRLSLTPRLYEVGAQVLGRDGLAPFQPPRPYARFRVGEAGGEPIPARGPVARTGLRDGPPTYVPHRWTVRAERTGPAVP